MLRSFTPPFMISLIEAVNAYNPKKHCRKVVRNERGEIILFYNGLVNPFHCSKILSKNGKQAVVIRQFRDDGAIKFFRVLEDVIFTI